MMDSHPVFVLSILFRWKPMVNNTLKKLSRVLVDNLVLVLVYYLAGHLSMHFLAMPPSNAAAIWPPAGISLAAVLLRGYRVLPAVFIGDLIIAIELFGFNDPFSIVFSLMVGLQAVLTAWIGAGLIHRFVGIHNLLIENKSIILFLFLGGPVASLLPSALAVGVEYYLQILAINDLSTGFLTWWQGGSIGVIIFSPLMLILFGNKEHRPRIVSVAIPLIFLFVLMVWIFNLSKTREEQRLTHTFKQQAHTLYTATVNKIDLLIYEIIELKNYIHATDELDKRKFADFSQHILTDRPEVLGLAWVPRVVHEARLSFEMMMNLSIAKQVQDRTSDSAEINEDYFPIQFITPFSGSEALTGFDMASNSLWKSVLDKAKKSGDSAIIFPMIISSETKIEKMTALVAPVFIHDEVNDYGDVSSKSLRGYAILFLPYQYVLKNAISEAQAQKINLKISVLGVNNNDVIGQLEANKFTFDLVRQMERFGLTAKFSYFPSADFVDSNSSLLVGWVFLIGLVVAGLFGFTLLSVTGQTVLIKRLVEKKTRDLNAERQFLQTVLDSVQEGILACDEKGVLRLFNNAAEKIYGRCLREDKPEQWLECFELQSLDGDSLLQKGENPLHRLLNSHEVIDFEFSLLAADQSMKILKANNAQVLNGQKQVIGAVVSFQDITIQKQYINQLKKLSWAVEYSPASILMTDKLGNIEYVNHKFVELTGYTMEEVKGKNPKILSSGETPVQEYKSLWDTVLAGKEWSGEFYNQKKDGEFYWSRQLISPIKNDQQEVTHFVAIQEDITEEKRLAEVISYQASHDELTGLLNRRECEERLSQIILSAQMQHSKHVFCFLDLDKFKVVNDSCGHLAGDHLLREVCELFKSQLRQRDTLARLGGDEFGIIMEHCSLRQAEVLTEKMCKVIKNYEFIWEDSQFTIGVSIGLAGIDVNSSNFTEVIRQADEACYAAKKAGRGQVRAYV